MNSNSRGLRRLGGAHRRRRHRPPAQGVMNWSRFFCFGALLASGLVATVPSVYSSDTHCLRYEPQTATLTGRLERRTYPGRPNYENVQNGDEPEMGLYLVLPHPVCTKGRGIWYGAQKDVTLVQLVLEQRDYVDLQPFLEKTVTLRGQLFSRQTAHHHAPLLLGHVLWDSRRD